MTYLCNVRVIIARTKIKKLNHFRLMETKKLSLKDCYESLGKPQKALRERIAEECGVSAATVFRWLSGEVVPDKLKRERIVIIVSDLIPGIKEEDLFPDCNNK